MSQRTDRPGGPRIWIAAEFFRAYGQNLIDGVAAWLGNHGPWEVYIDRSISCASLDKLDNYPPLDGVITEIPRGRIAGLSELIEAGLQVVCVEHDPDLDVPQVVPSDKGIGRAAGEYLRDLSLPHYAFLGLSGVRFSDERQEAYEAVLAEKGIAVLPGPRDPYGRQEGIEGLVEWALELPKPCGVLAINMLAAEPLLRACKLADVLVPEELAVLSVGNDERFCRLANPPLSAVDHNTARVGFEAAALMDRLLSGEPPPPGPIWIPPTGVVERHSTNVLAARNPYVARAVQVIAERAEEGLTVDDVVRAVHCPRRTLEQAFRRHLDRGIHEEILRRQLARARHLLTETHLAMADVAERSGFSSAARLSQVFRRELGTTPSAYRRRRSV
jgi:LacI family transcriptional regulator